MADLNPKPEEVADKVPALRTSFNENYADSISKGVYDQRDINRLENDDAYARTFLRTLQVRGDVAKAVQLIDDCFKFRKSIGIWDLKLDNFPTEIKDLDAIYYKGQDKDGHPIFYVNVKQNVATSEQIPVLKEYIAWNIEQHHAKNPEQMCVVLMDMGSTDPNNLSLDVIKYLMTCFTVYFPAFMAYMISYDMPALLSGTLSVLNTFLDSDQKQKLMLVKKNEIRNYISDEHLWPHMKG